MNDNDTESYADAASQTLARFAAHTRHSPSECENVTKLAQKWLALHIKSVAPELIVAQHVSSDYELMKLRTYNPPIAVAYEAHAPDTRTFIYLMKHGYARNEPVQGAAQFRDALFPRPRDEESWVAYHERADEHWKERAYYVATQCGYPYGLVEAIYADGLNRDLRDTKDGASDMYTRINAYVRDHGPQPEDVGAMIGALQVDLFVGDGEKDTEALEDYKQHLRERGELEEQEDVEQIVAHEMQMVFSPMGEQSTPIPNVMECVTAYKTTSLLPATFPTHKVLKQMTLARAGMTGAEPVVKESGILSRAQTRFEPLTAEMTLPAGALVHDAPVGFETKLDTASPALQELYAGLAFSGTAAEFVRAALDMYAHKEQSLESPFERKYKKRYPTLDASIVRAILEM